MLILKRHFRLAVLTSIVASVPYVADARLPGHDVKAAFLVNFAKFTEWPAGTFSSPAAPIVVGIAGDEILRYTIIKSVRGRSFNGRRVETRNITNASDALGVHIIFISALTGKRTTDILKSVRGVPVLTVGDSDRFCQQGGMIGFLVDQDHLRFEISVDATEEARLKVSSRVLTLAKTVYGRK